MYNISEFIDKSFSYLRKTFKEKSENEFEFLEVYPYLEYTYAECDFLDVYDDSIHDYIGELYETMLPINVNKD